MWDHETTSQQIFLDHLPDLFRSTLHSETKKGNFISSILLKVLIRRKTKALLFPYLTFLVILLIQFGIIQWIGGCKFSLSDQISLTKYHWCMQKVKTSWEGEKFWKKNPYSFQHLLSKRQTKWNFSSNFWGFFRKP